MTGPGDVLLFDLDGATYALDATLVRETLWLPELVPADDAPPGIIGVFNLRGTLVPVVDLAARLGHGAHRCRTDDQLVVLVANGAALAVIVHAVRDLAHLSPGALLPPPDYASERPGGLVTGNAQVGDTLAALLDVQALYRPAVAGDLIAEQAGETRHPQGTTPEELALFRRRASSLRQPAAPEVHGRRAFAVVELGGQCLGIALAAVRHFCRVGTLRRIPCCPPHVAGVFSLRGHLVTLLEVASALSLPTPSAPRAMAAVGSIGEHAVALGVDDVIGVIDPQEADLQVPPPELERRHGADIQAITTFAGRTVALVDLPGLLAREEWVVNEVVS